LNPSIDESVAGGLPLLFSLGAALLVLLCSLALLRVARRSLIARPCCLAEDAPRAARRRGRAVRRLLRWLWLRRPVSRRAEVSRQAEYLRSHWIWLDVQQGREATQYGRGKVAGVQDAWALLIERSDEAGP
jgi:hypothetical protein